LNEKPAVPAGYSSSDLSPNGFMKQEVFRIFNCPFAVADGWISQQAKACQKTGIW
jgi:hypothetical protein